MDKSLEERTKSCELNVECPYYRGLTPDQRKYCTIEFKLQCDYYIETMQRLKKPIKIPVSMIDKVFVIENEPLYTFDENDYLVEVDENKQN